ncbi:hypothetical protein 7AX1_22 [uncultured Caudovirales phage]|uniref:DUF7644 domain-containing protein n=1 Tax=uncultured Caudovirales phage TaxID=2100421 RepID=A0A2H4IZ68_9CAUD|nr:hypothetical protein 7AX1_22 [uncultured Caudovirales phage]
MNRLKHWFNKNVLKKEKDKYKVYFIHKKFDSRVPVIIDVEATSKVDAKKKTLKFIKKYASDSGNYKFLKVEYK